MAQRRSVLDAFKADRTLSVILLSVKAGGEGLNLQEATRVLVLEPWWNPQVENQAIQRAHRIGQNTADSILGKQYRSGGLRQPPRLNLRSSTDTTTHARHL